MEKKINLEEFWAKRYPNGKLPKYAKEITIELIKEVLELAAENAECESEDDKTGTGREYFWVNKQSILNTINQVE